MFIPSDYGAIVGDAIGSAILPTFLETTSVTGSRYPPETSSGYQPRNSEAPVLMTQHVLSVQPLPYQCRTPGCNRKFRKPEHLRQHTKDVHSPSRSRPSRPPLKQETSQLSLLHQHTAQAHPKPNKKTPSSS